MSENPETEVPAMPALSAAVELPMSATSDAAASMTPPCMWSVCKCSVCLAFDHHKHSGTLNLPDDIDKALKDTSEYARQARSHMEMCKACWIMMLQACREMRDLVSTLVPAEHMPPSVLSAFDRSPHDPAVPESPAPSDPLFPPELQLPAHVTRAVHTVRTISRHHVRNVMQRTVRDASLYAAVRRQG